MRHPTTGTPVPRSRPGFADVFADVVVRRGDHPMPVGDLLALQLPPQAQTQPVDQPAQG